MSQARPGHVRGLSPEQKIVAEIAACFGNQLNVNTMQMAFDLTLLPSDVQKRVGELVFNLIGLWAENADAYSPEHPLQNEWQTAKRMVDGLFDKTNR